MKTKLLYLLLFISSCLFAQIPTDDHKRYLFTNGSLVNTGSGGATYNLQTNVYVNPPTAVTDRDGNANNAISVNGTRFFAGEISSANNQINDQKIAYSFWIKTDGSQAGVTQAELLNQWRNNTGEGIRLRLENNGKISCFTRFNILQGSNETSNYQSTISVTDDQWHHIVYQVFKTTNPSNSTERRYETELYIDGVLNNSSQQLYYNDTIDVVIWQTNIGGSVKDLFIGALFNGGAIYQDQFDDLRVYERKLTVDEVIYLSGGTPPPPPPADPIVNIPDTNFKTHLLNDGNVNTNSDNEIQVSEADAYTGTINVQNKGISDLTGIEAFVNITQLYCGYNNLTTLDASANTDLIAFWCNNNALTSLTLPSTNTLTQLRCNDNNLTGLDVSNLPVINQLRCENNSLTTIDVTSNVNLFTLTCYNNNLSTIDVSASTNLNYFDCNFNNLSVLDVSTNINLTYLTCNNNNLTTIDVSSNTALQSFTCVNNPSLTSLNLANGNNANLIAMWAHNNAALVCIQHDTGFTPPAYDSNTGMGWQKDTGTSYSDNCSSLSTTSFEVEVLNLYPNPAISTLHIESTKAITKLEIYNLLGKKILESTKTTVHVSGLTKGMYLIKIYSDSQHITKRFIKR